MAITVDDVNALFPPMSMANPTNSNINRALRLTAGLAPLADAEAAPESARSKSDRGSEAEARSGIPKEDAVPPPSPQGAKTSESLK